MRRSHRMPVRLTAMLALLVALSLPLTSARAQTPGPEETAAYNQVMEASTPEACLACVDEFVQKYPESRYILNVLNKGIQTQAEVDPTAPNLDTLVERLAANYKRMGSNEAMAYNSVAWSLYSSGTALSKAAIYADKAIDAAAMAPPGTQAMIMDTAAHIAAAQGDMDRAVTIGRQAVEADPNTASFKASLGGYLVETGALQEAEGLLSEAVLGNPADDDAIKAFDTLAEKRGMGDPQAYKERIIRASAKKMLDEAEDRAAVQAALGDAFVSMGILLEQARQYAEAAVAASGPETGATSYFGAQLLMARVEMAEGDVSGALKRLNGVLSIASPYDSGYHLARGEALEKLGRDQEAIKAYMEGVAAYANPQVMAKLEPLYEKVHGEKESLADAIKTAADATAEWKPEGQFSRPTGYAGRVVLAELFTGAECPPCVASDVAYDHLLEYYPRDYVAILEYHEHIPGPDPMTNPDTEARMAYYNRDTRVIGGTPTSIVDGTDASVGGGPIAAAKSRFGLYSFSLDGQLTTKPSAEIIARGSRKGDMVSFSGDVRWNDASGLQDHDLKLRVALVEKQIDYTGSNGVSEHKMVVRSFIGGTDGYQLTPGKDTKGLSGSAAISQIEADLASYVDQWEKDNARRFRNGGGFAAKPTDLAEGNLALVVFVQDDTDFRVLQAKVIDLK